MEKDKNLILAIAEVEERLKDHGSKGLGYCIHFTALKYGIDRSVLAKEMGERSKQAMANKRKQDSSAVKQEPLEGMDVVKASMSAPKTELEVVKDEPKEVVKPSIESLVRKQITDSLVKKIMSESIFTEVGDGRYILSDKYEFKDIRTDYFNKILRMIYELDTVLEKWNDQTHKLIRGLLRRLFSIIFNGLNEINMKVKASKKTLQRNYCNEFVLEGIYELLHKCSKCSNDK